MDDLKQAALTCAATLSDSLDLPVHLDVEGPEYVLVVTARPRDRIGQTHRYWGFKVKWEIDFKGESRERTED